MDSTILTTLAFQTGKLALFLIVILIAWPLLVGWLTAHLARFVQRTLVTNFSERAQYWAGGLGVIIHELGHLVFALLFMHRISSFKLLNLSENHDGSLGSVSSNYNPRNWYQAVGNFFIGLAPMFSGIFVLDLLIQLLCHPDYQPVGAPEFINQQQPLLDYAQFAWQTTLTWLDETGQAFLTSAWWRQLLLLVLIGTISTTAFSLSTADLKSSWQGAKVYLILVIVFSIVITVIKLIRPDFGQSLDQFVLLTAVVWLVLLILIYICLLISWIELMAISLVLRFVHLK
ncbi:hypothetical protein M3M39_00215 [Fructilactobacillus hinvesii]|uniref:Integral membrane protein n=1 Tax=Fructilactobacillus hinvesii TaxID=2940300 RepID=A0ABY5BVF0_9LACO|nr:hypothetical protein [Fructilactobacillus hinvesii]USS87951.1 hypothetical protein M3M39_00215 [Fructilactobacillus hinvesii]